jgi:hypothetical protein
MLDHTAIKRPPIIVQAQNCFVAAFSAFWPLKVAIAIDVVVE